MKMFKLKSLGLLALALCLTAGFSSCSKHDAENYVEGWIDDLVGATSKTYNSNGLITGNITSLIDIQVVYTHGDKTITKTIDKDGSWSETLESITTSESVVGKFVVVRNSTPVDEATTYSLSCNVSNSFTYYSDKGKVLDTVETGGVSKTLNGIKSDKIDEVIENLNKTTF